MRTYLFTFCLLAAALVLAVLQADAEDNAVSPDSDIGRKVLELDSKGRAVQNAAVFSKALQDYEKIRGGICTNVLFERLQEPGKSLSRYVRLYTMEGASTACGKRIYRTLITFRDSANTVARRIQICIGPDEETDFRKKAAEFVG
ncbi:MAG TPA: hypothetical protein VFB72_09675 [Verrucomicrobiae bacterium]|nr:hypothetical protein [Verrucomicrobiae bacterium]